MNIVGISTMNGDCTIDHKNEEQLRIFSMRIDESNDNIN